MLHGRKLQTFSLQIQQFSSLKQTVRNVKENNLQLRLMCTARQPQKKMRPQGRARWWKFKYPLDNRQEGGKHRQYGLVINDQKSASPVESERT